MIAKDDYYMAIAKTVALRSNCVGRSVGAVVVRGDRIVATGYNGTAGGLKNCLDGGCIRCANRELFPSGTAYDLCICVHAEANAIASAARHGIALEGGALYTTDQPCFSCAKELIQVGIGQVFSCVACIPDDRVAADYDVAARSSVTRVDGGFVRFHPRGTGISSGTNSRHLGGAAYTLHDGHDLTP